MYYLSLTNKGKKLSAAMIEDHTKMHVEILQSIPADNQLMLFENLEHLNEAVEKWLQKQ